jgi:hypothetical protein
MVPPERYPCGTVPAWFSAERLMMVIHAVLIDADDAGGDACKDRLGEATALVDDILGVRRSRCAGILAAESSC